MVEIRSEVRALNASRPRLQASRSRSQFSLEVVAMDHLGRLVNPERGRRVLFLSSHSSRTLAVAASCLLGAAKGSSSLSWSLLSNVGFVIARAGCLTV